jgi:hypothetical protein
MFNQIKNTICKNSKNICSLCPNYNCLNTKIISIINTNKTLSLVEISNIKINNETDEIKVLYVSKNPYYIADIINPSVIVQFASVIQDGHTLKLIKNPYKIVKIASEKQLNEINIM